MNQAGDSTKHALTKKSGVQSSSLYVLFMSLDRLNKRVALFRKGLASVKMTLYQSTGVLYHIKGFDLIKRSNKNALICIN